nr:hypothetical protein [Tanacetum cinerariifolium]
MQTQTSNTLHNAIMEAGSKDRPPMLAPGIDNDIYSTVDACPNACEMWKAIERLKLGESINVQDLETNLYWEFEKFISQDEWQRFVTLVNQSQELKIVSYHKLYDILKQHQHEVNEIRAEKIARVANPLALVINNNQSMILKIIILTTLRIPQPDHNKLLPETEEKQLSTLHNPSMIKNLQWICNVAGARETVGSTAVQKSRIQCYNCKEFGHVARECQKPKRAKDAAYHREKMMLSYYMYMVQLQAVSPDAADSGPIFDDEPLQKVSNDDHYNVEEINQNDDDNDLAEERELLASLIEKLKCEINESKNRNKFLETSTKTLIEKLKELARRNSKEYASQMELECAKVRDKLSAHQETISILSTQKEAQIKLYKTQEDKELEKVIKLENKVKVLDNIVYKSGQSVQTMNMLNNKCRMSFAKPKFLKKAKIVNPRLYDIGCYNDNLTLMLAPESDEVIRLEKESRSKLSDLIKPFDYTKLNNLYDLFVPQRERSSEQ